MKTDKRKLFGIFRARAENFESSEVVDWQNYIREVGCRSVMTPHGMLPFRKPNFIHILDPWHMDKNFHIQVPKVLAERILVLGLP
jgi:hypothetical protein